MPFIILAVVLLLAVLLAAFFMRQRMRSLENRLTSSNEEISALRGEMEALLSGARGAGDRLRQLEERLRQQDDRQQQLGRQGPDANSMRQAIELARKGATTEELKSICGLSHGEAELLVMMHRARGE